MDVLPQLPFRLPGGSHQSRRDPSMAEARCFELTVVAARQFPEGFGTGVALLLHRLGARRIRGPMFYRQPLAAIWRGLSGSDESLQADETVVGAALSCWLGRCSVLIGGAGT